jgi:hypothetical protein
LGQNNGSWCQNHSDNQFMTDLSRRATVAIVRPPLIALRWILGNAYRILFSWWLDDRLLRHAREKFGAQVRENVPFLFTEHNATIVPNDREPPPYFDFAKVTVAAEDLRFIFTRDRGAVHLAVAPAYAPNEWQDFSALLKLIDGRETDYSRLQTIAGLLPSRMAQLKEILSEGRYPKTKELLSHVYEDRFEQTKRLEKSVNRRLYGP